VAEVRLVIARGWTAEIGPMTSKESPSALRVINVYNPSCGARASAMSGRRPVNAAMPQSAASEALAVYQA
jgi:hypothetical protein